MYYRNQLHLNLKYSFVFNTLTIPNTFCCVFLSFRSNKEPSCFTTWSSLIYYHHEHPVPFFYNNHLLCPIKCVVFLNTFLHFDILTRTQFLNFRFILCNVEASFYFLLFHIGLYKRLTDVGINFPSFDYFLRKLYNSVANPVGFVSQFVLLIGNFPFQLLLNNLNIDFVFI